MCADGAEQGFCEASGYCSFPDPDCPSMRRFGQLSPEHLAGECVEGEPVATSGTTGSGSGSGSASGPASTTALDDSSGGSSSGGLDCPNPLADDFEDGTLDPIWETYRGDGIFVDELDGVLQFTVEPGGNDRFGGVVIEDLRDLRGVVVEAELLPIGDEAHDGVEFWLSIGTDDCSNEIGISGDRISAYSEGDMIIGDPISPSESLRVRFRVEPDELTHWEYWRDGGWQSLYSDYSVCELDWGGYALFGSTDDDVLDGTYVRRIEYFSACEP
jgi:hypothetical protein